MNLATWKQFTNRLFNSSKRDHYSALGYFLRKTKTHIEPQQIAQASSWLSERQKQKAESPSEHPWLSNMRRLLRTLGSYARLIQFLDWCVAKRFNPWIGRIQQFLRLSQTKLAHVMASNGKPKLSRLHARMVRTITLCRDLTITQLRHFIRNDMADNPTQAKIDRADLIFLIEEGFIRQDIKPAGRWFKRVFNSA